MIKRNERLRLVFFASVGFVFFFFIFSYLKIITLVNTSARLNHNTQVTLQLEKIIGSLKDAETGHRGYLLTHEKAFLEPYIKGLKKYPEYIALARRLLADNPPQQNSINTVEFLARNRENYLKKTLEIDKIRKPSATELLKGKSIMDSLRAEINLMIARENSLMDIRTRDLNRQTIIAPITLLISGLLALTILTISYWLLNNALLKA